VESDDTLRRLFETMLLIRAFEPEAERQYKAAKIGGYCHLATGQEAAHVGAVGAMAGDDVLITAYRDHGLALARGVDPNAVMAELFGRVDGCAHGRGGSMHLLDVGRGYLGGWGIVGGHLPVATGVALELARRGERRAVLCELGDGAVNTGCRSSSTSSTTSTAWARTSSAPPPSPSCIDAPARTACTASASTATTCSPC
jgi:pyruvate dehydrogenase E1 component subunit alpha